MSGFTVRKVLQATGEEVLETRTSKRDSTIPEDEIVVRIRGLNGNEREDQMKIFEYESLGPKLES